jgi:hypothetical protein
MQIVLMSAHLTRNAPTPSSLHPYLNKSQSSCIFFTKFVYCANLSVRRISRKHILQGSNSCPDFSISNGKIVKSTFSSISAILPDRSNSQRLILPLSFILALLKLTARKAIKVVKNVQALIKKCPFHFRGDNVFTTEKVAQRA